MIAAIELILYLVFVDHMLFHGVSCSQTSFARVETSAGVTHDLSQLYGTLVDERFLTKPSSLLQVFFQDSLPCPRSTAAKDISTFNSKFSNNATFLPATISIQQYEYLKKQRPTHPDWWFARSLSDQIVSSAFTLRPVRNEGPSRCLQTARFI
jgi:hypothetical protein